MTILNGESLGNDATALTLFRVFVAVAAGTGATVLGGVGMFVLAAVGGMVVGFVVGWVVHRIRRKLDDPQVESALGLVVPFGVYLLAESLHTLRGAGGGRGRHLPRLPLTGERLRHAPAGPGRLAGERHDPRVGRLRADRAAGHQPSSTPRAPARR